MKGFRVPMSLLVLAVFLSATAVSAAPVVVSGCGNIAPRVAEFRALLGDPSNVATPTNASGRREINWDGVPAGQTNVSTFPPNFFNSNSPRGVVFSTPGTGFRVSDTNFSDINATYASQFAAFSTAKTFAPIGSNVMDVTFFVPGSTDPATVSAFGAVFSDVDSVGTAFMEFYSGEELLGSFIVPVRCDATGHSFLGVAFNDGERITRVRIFSGAAGVSSSLNDISAGGSQDLVVMDDFFYAEPVAGDAADHVLTAALLGTNELPGPGDADGSGFAVVSIDPAAGTLSYTISVANISAPTMAHIHTGNQFNFGGILIDLAPTFTNNLATKTITGLSAATLNQILANPSNFYVNVHNGDFPAGAVRGQLTEGTSPATKLTLPVVARVPGAAGTSYRSDLRLVNTTGAPAVVLMQFYNGGNVANAAPSNTATITLAPGEQRAIDDVLLTQFNITQGAGALQLFTSRGVVALARIYNDQRASNNGTFGQFEPAVDDSVSSTSNGLLPGLSNSPIGAGPFRTNVGFFNASSSTAAVAMRAHDATGAVVASTTFAVPAFGQVQQPVASWFPTLGARENFYITFNTDSPTVYGYASVVDNVNGDAVFIHAQ